MAGSVYKDTMVSLKYGILVIVSVIGIIETRQLETTATLAPELKTEEEPTGNEAPALRSGLDNYDMYQYPDSSGLPIQDIFKTILLDHQLPKKYATHLDDTILDYEEDLLLDSPILDSPLLGSLLYDHPYYGSPIVDAGAIIKTPLIKNSLVKGSIIKRPVIKRPVLSPLVLNQYKKKQETLREIEILLKTLLPLIKSSSVPMKARLQIGRQGEELTK